MYIQRIILLINHFQIMHRHIANRTGVTKDIIRGYLTTQNI